MINKVQALGWILAMLVFLSACKNKAEKTSIKEENSQSGFNLDPRLHQTDSLVISFYKDPYGEDSIRYTRYYTQTSVTDQTGIKALKDQLNEIFIKKEHHDNCRGEGKIWCFSKGRIFQTVYFSTRCNECCFVYLIKDGNFYYSPLSGQFSAWLSGQKLLSKEPGIKKED
jgi:hypothetical protein